METKPILLQDRPIHSSKETLLKVLDLMDDRFQSTALRNDLASLFSLSLDQPADTFTPSQAYRFSIAKATLEHMNDHGLRARLLQGNDAQCGDRFLFLLSKECSKR